MESGDPRIAVLHLQATVVPFIHGIMPSIDEVLELDMCAVNG